MHLAVVRSTCILAIVGLALLLAGDAGAVGGVIGPAGESLTVAEARYAVAISPAETTRWASIKLQNFPGAMAWLVPIRPGARVDEVSDAWFEALELATAPRIVPTSCGATSVAAATEIVGLPNRVTTERSLESTVIDVVPALRAFASARGLELAPELEHRFEDLHERGFLLAAFLYAGPASGGFTRTIRVTDDSFPVVPLFMTLGVNTPVRVTAFLIGAARARLGRGPEIEINPASVTFPSKGASDYEKVRTAQLLSAGGESWIIEASERDLLLTGARRPGGIEVTPPIAPTYDQRAASYGDPSDDLTRAISGLDGAKVWVTRAAGILPARTLGDDIAVTIAPGASKSPFVLTTQLPLDCVPPVVMPPAAMTPVAPPVATKPSPRDPGTLPPPAPGPVVVETRVVESPPPAQVEVSGSCDGSPSSQPQEESSTSDDSCSHSDTSSDSSSSDDGCDSSSDQSSSDSTDDGCDSSSSSSDSSSDQSGGGCDSGSDSSSSSNSSCSLSRRPKRGRSRTSLVAWGICAVLLPLRRSIRRREGVGRC